MKTIDPLSLLRLKSLHPKCRQIAIDSVTETTNKLPESDFVCVVETLRTFAQSDAYYAQGRTTPGEIITDAPAGHSYHNYGLAFDAVLIINNKKDWRVTPEWMAVVNEMKSHGWHWGGDFKLKNGKHDTPHFEMKFGYQPTQLLKLYQGKHFIPGTAYVKI